MISAVLALLCLLLAAIAQPAAAQAVTRYTNSTDSATGEINETTRPCVTGSMFQRTFTVSASYVISDVNLGVLLAHTYRGDLQMYLTSPSGTRVQLKNSDNTNNSANFNALFDDSGTTAVASYTAAATATASTVVPPYTSTIRPVSGLTAFNGQNALGTWTLEICDALSGDSGTFYQADLYLTSAPSSYADLSLAMSVSNTLPTLGANVYYTLKVTNNSTSPLSASGITARATLPTGFIYSSYSGSGTYSSSTGNWTVGSLAPGQSATLIINGTVSATLGSTANASAEITASSVVDIDSTVNNGVTTEDDYGTASFTVVARSPGIAPTLTCTSGTSIFDWDNQAWSAGSTSNSYTLSGIGSIAFSITNPGTYITNATYGGTSPTRQNAATGGLTPAQYSLAQIIDLPSQTDVATTTITLGTAVPGAQFQIFDVDYASGQFADKVTVSGSLNGVTVLPTLTNGVTNYVIGNTAYGDATSADNQSYGNITVTFSSAIDKITIAYGDHSLAPTNPGQQGIELFDMTFCRPVATVSVTKVSSVLSDPVNGSTNPKAIPGAVVEYCILVSNTGSTNVTSVAASDPLPTAFTYSAGTMTSGTNCSSATTAEDDNDTGTDESDPFGASVIGTTLTATASSLNAGQAFALKFRGTIK